MKIELTSDFLKALKSLSPENRKATGRTLKKREVEQVPHSVNLQPLKGRRGYWIVNVNKKYRIIAEKYKTNESESKSVLRLLYVGSHDTTYNRSTR